MDQLFKYQGWGFKSGALELALAARFDLYRALGFITPEGFIIGKELRPYECPTAHQVMEYIMDSKGMIHEQKADQGFQELEVAIDVPLKHWLDAIRIALLGRSRDLGSASGSVRLDVDTNEPIEDRWTDALSTDTLVYSHRGKYVDKTTFYTQQPFPGLHIAFVLGGAQGHRPRRDLGPTRDPIGCSRIVRKGYDYEHETLFTMDLALAQILRAIVEPGVMPYVQRSGLVDQGAAWCGRNLLNPEHSDRKTPNVFWSQHNKQLWLKNHCVIADNDYAIPTSVDVI
jgi:hypothetical protein